MADQQFKKVVGGLDRIEKKAEGTSKRFSGLGQIAKGALQSIGASAVQLAARGLQALGGVVVDSSRKFQSYERSMRGIQQLILTTGNAAQRSAEDIDKIAIALSESTLASRQGVLEASKALLSFKSVSGDVFDRTLASAQDLTEILGSDLKSATVQLAKALEDPIKGLGALSRSGVSFTDGQTKLIKSLVESGNQLKAQEEILRVVEAQSKGAAEAAGNTLAGSFDTLGERTDRLQTAFGSTLAPAIKATTDLASDFIAELLEQDSVTNAVTAASEALASAIESVDLDQLVDGFTTFVNVLRATGEALSRVVELYQSIDFSRLNILRNAVVDPTTRAIANSANQRYESEITSSDRNREFLRQRNSRRRGNQRERRTTLSDSPLGTLNSEVPLTQNSIRALARRYNLTSTPGNGFGDIRTFGNRGSHHRRGNAVDYGDAYSSKANLEAFVNHILSTPEILSQIDELIYTPVLGDQMIRNGRRVNVSQALQDSHRDHVHLAETNRGESSRIPSRRRQPVSTTSRNQTVQSTTNGIVRTNETARVESQDSLNYRAPQRDVDFAARRVEEEAMRAREAAIRAQEEFNRERKTYFEEEQKGLSTIKESNRELDSNISIVGKQLEALKMGEKFSISKIDLLKKEDEITGKLAQKEEMLEAKVKEGLITTEEKKKVLRGYNMALTEQFEKTGKLVEANERLQEVEKELAATEQLRKKYEDTTRALDKQTYSIDMLIQKQKEAAAFNDFEARQVGETGAGTAETAQALASARFMIQTNQQTGEAIRLLEEQAALYLELNGGILPDYDEKLSNILSKQEQLINANDGLTESERRKQAAIAKSTEATRRQNEILQQYEQLTNTASSAFSRFSINVLSGAQGIGAALNQVASSIFGTIAQTAFGNVFGGIFGGLLPFADGGVVTKATPALIGEAGAEAVVPLPNGRSIPVTLEGGSQSSSGQTINITVNVDGNSGGGSQDNARLGRQISQAVKAILVDQQRVGGILR